MRVSQLPTNINLFPVDDLSSVPPVTSTPLNVPTPATFNCFDKNVPSAFAVEMPARVVLKELSPHTQRPVQQPITNSVSAVTEDA